MVVIIIHCCHHHPLLLSFSSIFSSCIYATRKLQKLWSPVGDCNFEAFFLANSHKMSKSESKRRLGDLRRMSRLLSKDNYNFVNVNARKKKNKEQKKNPVGAHKPTVANEASGFSPFLPINRILYQSVFSRLLRNSTPNFVHPLVGPSCFTFLCFAVFCPTSPAVVNLRDWVNCVSSLVNWVTILNVTNHGVFYFQKGEDKVNYLGLGMGLRINNAGAPSWPVFPGLFQILVPWLPSFIN